MATHEMRVVCTLDAVDVARRVHGEWSVEPLSPITGVCLDSRVVQHGDLFVALPGEMSDGHQFVGSAMRNGASGVIVSSVTSDTDRDIPCLRVRDTLAALHSLAKGNRESFTGRVVALTGSVGKTTVKEMTSSILKRAGTTAFTVGNFNNKTGVPLSILQINKHVKYAVIELGMSMPGEILALMPMVRPHVVGVLNVAPVHMENFANLEAIRDAKAEIFTHLEDEAVAVLNADDPLVRGMNPGPEVRKQFFGTSLGADLRVGETRGVTLEGQQFDLLCGEYTMTVRLAALGEHNRLNAAAAAALGLAAGASVEAVVEGLDRYRPGMMRSELIDLSDGSILFNDCYNASPRAFEEALKTLVVLPKAGRRVVVMGDMLELGTDSVEYHRKVGERAAELGVDVFLGFGPLTIHAVRAFEKRAPTRVSEHFADLNNLLREFVKIHGPDDIILVKGSRGMRMERVAERLKAQCPPHER